MFSHKQEIRVPMSFVETCPVLSGKRFLEWQQPHNGDLLQNENNLQEHNPVLNKQKLIVLVVYGTKMWVNATVWCPEA